MFTVILSDKYLAFEGDKSPQLFRTLLSDSVVTCLCLSKDKCSIKINTEIQKFLVPFPLLIKILSEFKVMKRLLLFQTPFIFSLKISYSSFAILSLHLLVSLCFRLSVFQRPSDVRYTLRFPLLLFDLSIFTWSLKGLKRLLHWICIFVVLIHHGTQISCPSWGEGLSMEIVLS